MKTKLVTLLALISMNINLVSAHINSPKGDDGPSKSEWTVPVSFLTPVTPVEATFEDATNVNPVVVPGFWLAPVTPKDATFEELPYGEETITTITPAVDQKVGTVEKRKTVHPGLPGPCDAKYGCSL